MSQTIESRKYACNPYRWQNQVSFDMIYMTPKHDTQTLYITFIITFYHDPKQACVIKQYVNVW